MLQISPIPRPGRFLNEDMPFVNTAGTMNFNLTSPELLDLASYQQTLKRLIATLAASSASTPGRSNTNTNTTTPTTTTTTEVILGSGGAFVLDTSVIEPGFEAAVIGRDGTAQYLSSSQSYPLSFIATSQLPPLRSPSSGKNGAHPQDAAPVASSPVLYFIRLPWNPLTHGIQCQLSARRLCTRHVSLLDRVLRRLCDASPGAFMVGYSDGLSGMDAGSEVVYSGENSSHQSQPSKAPYQQHQHQMNQAAGIDHRTAGLVGHVEHPTTTAGAEGQRQQDSQLHPSSAKNVKAPRANTTEGVEQSSEVSELRAGERNVEKGGIQDALMGGDGAEGALNYDFGLLDDTDQLIDVRSLMDIDELHDVLWVN